MVFEQKCVSKIFRYENFSKSEVIAVLLVGCAGSCSGWGLQRVTPILKPKLKKGFQRAF